MLTSIGAGNPDYRGPDWADMWALSKEHRVRVGQITRAMETPPATQTDTSVSDDSNYYAASFLTQTLVVLRRAFTAQWRKPEYTYGKIVIQVVSDPPSQLVDFKVITLITKLTVMRLV